MNRSKEYLRIRRKKHSIDKENKDGAVNLWRMFLFLKKMNFNDGSKLEWIK